MELADRESHSFTYQDIKTHILPELQKGVEMAVRRQFRKLLFLLGALVVVSNKQQVYPLTHLVLIFKLLSSLFPSDERYVVCAM